MDRMHIEAAREDTPFLANYTFLNHAAISPIPRSVQRAMMRAAEMHVHVLAASEDPAHAEYARGRSLAASLVGARQGRVAYVQNTSIGMSMIAAGIHAKLGDNVVVPAMEFPSNLLPWIQLEAAGIEVRRVQAIDGRITADALRSHVDARTRVVALSHVQYYNGYRVDLDAIGELCRQADALLVVDGTQSIGALKLDMEACGVDVVVAASHKWMLGPVGTGFMAFSSRAMDRIRPALVGWLSVKDPFAFHRTLDFLETAERFEPGSENSVGIFGLAQRFASIDEIGMAAIESRVLHLVGYLFESARSAGLDIANPLEEGERSGIVLLRHPTRRAEDVHSDLAQNKILTSVRSGAIRLSPHYHNTVDELDQVIGTVKNRTPVRRLA
ncbi:cysteine desulfurase [Burkholderia lata]|uniref:aminotransferase class V-fold PLP-dependent enzyme n=1 Tax=Burkholderia lata (strain ATCC 17760 / DSM 23089 / LMG 22485 / NCIMB 9086 / R18194 / 383) TaxID=482957 RepID=UPI001454AB5C|nr:aminotransferase class V-fold PLP-dependent enzyme [Burkholderia lata]VWD64595.1 cysteine desulfurase [Burkholderia lata]